MINRIKTLNTANIKYRFFIIIWTIFISTGIYIAADMIFNPPTVHSRYVDDGVTHSFYAVGADNLRQEADDYLLTLINEEKELIDIVTKDSQTKDELLNASPENPVRIIGETYNAIDSDEVSEAYFEDLKAVYFADAKKLYGYQLIEKKIKIGIGHYIGLLCYIILFLGNLILMIILFLLSMVEKEEVVSFYKQHPEFNNRKSDFDFQKNIPVIDNYILHPKAIIDVKKSTDFELVYHPYRRRLYQEAYHSLNCVDENGDNQIVNMGLLSETKIEVLEAYLSEYGKTLKVIKFD